MAKARLEDEIDRFLDAWLGARQIIQAANFNRFQRNGLSATQFMTLNLLPADQQGLNLSELAKRMNLSLPTLAKTVDSLEARGMLSRTRSDSDRRVVHLTLTAKGKELQNASSKEFKAHMTKLFCTMHPKQRTGLIEGLEALVQHSANLPFARQREVSREMDDAVPKKRSSLQSRKQ